MMRRLVISVLLLSLCACSGKDPDIADYVPPSIVALRAEPGEDYSTVRIVCEVSQADGIKDYGILFGESELRRISATNLKENVFSVEVDGLGYSKRYVYQAYIDGGRGTIYSAVQMWTTVDENPPVPSIVRTTRGLGADAGKVTLTCFIQQLAQTVGADRLQCGVCFGLPETEPGLSDSFVEAESFSASGSYAVEIAGLTPTVSYAFRPYTKIDRQVSYGEVVTLRIPSSAEVVHTEGFTDLTHNSVTLEGALSGELEEGEDAVCAFEINGTTQLSEKPRETGHFFLTLGSLQAETDYSFRAVARVGNNTFYGETLSFRTKALPVVEEGYVDLGLSVLWGTCNLGATSPKEEGSKFAWGETEPKQSGGWEDYKWCMGSPETLTKYTLSVDSPQPDNKTRLDPEDDAAFVSLGGKWRMPTAAEYQELLEHCTITEEWEGETKGFQLTSTVPGYTDRSVHFFNSLPGVFLYCWTSDLCTGYSAGAQIFTYLRYFNDKINDIDYALRVLDIMQVYWGAPVDEVSRVRIYPIRPVRDR